MIEIVTRDAARLVAEIVAALVGRNDVKAPSRKRPDLVTPAVPEFRESVQEKDERPCFGDMQMNSVGWDAGKAHSLGEFGYLSEQARRQPPSLAGRTE